MKLCHDCSDPCSKIAALASRSREGKTDMLARPIRAIVELLTQKGLICLDLADIREVLADKRGFAVYGEGEACGEGRAIRAADAAIPDLKQALSQLKNRRYLITPSRGLRGSFTPKVP